MHEKDPKDEGKVLGDINPRRHAVNSHGEAFRDRTDVSANDEDVDPVKGAEPQPSGARRSGSRDVTEDQHVSGTRNQHSTGGAAGSDLGNRPE